MASIIFRLSYSSQRFLSGRIQCHGLTPSRPFSSINGISKSPRINVHSPRHPTTHVQRRYIHPLVLLALKPLGKVTAIVTGRTFRRTWKGLSPEKKLQIKKKIAEHKNKIRATGVLLISAAVIHFVTHIQETPITGRKRFVAFTPEQFKKIANFEYEMQMESVKENIVRPDHPIYTKVVDIAQKIVNSNQDLEFFRQQKWTVIVINSKEQNAMVLPTGHIFVFTGLLQITDNDDRLAVVLGHEMAHALLGHGAEHVSVAAVLDWAIILLMAAAWALMPSDGIALVTQWFYNKVIHILMELPYSRKLEEEADEVGLQLAAKACYDVREGSALWGLMAVQGAVHGQEEPPQWLSTHPNNSTRVEKLEQLMPKALAQREYCQCGKLPSRDPREAVAALHVMLAELAEAKAEAKAEEAKAAEARTVARVGGRAGQS